jgi:hypothetical protein
MANKKINQLVSKTAILSTDIFGIGDATTGQLFKKTIAELQAAIGGAVISVNGLVGTVVLDTDDIQELATPTNKYFTDARARGAISLTVTGNSGASTYSSGTGVLNVPTYTLAGLGGITATFLSGTSGISYNSGTGVISYSGTVYTDASIRALLSGSTGISYNSSTGAISYSGTVYTDSSVRALISITTTGDSGASTYNNTTGVINVPNYTLAGLGGISYTSLSGGTGISYNSSTGAISSTITQYTDALARASVSLTTTGTSGASTYNSTTGVFNIPQYQAVLTNPVTGTGTSGHVAYWNGSGSIAGSANHFWDNTNSRLGIGTVSPSQQLHISKAGTTLIKIQNTASGLDVGLELVNTVVTGFMGVNATEAFIYTQSSHPIVFYTSTVERMRISSTGSVGIGTSTPDQLLSLRKTSAGAETIALALQNIGSTAGTAVSMIFCPHESSATPEPLAKISAIRTAASGALTDLAFSTYGTGGLIEKMRINSTGDLTLNNNTSSITSINVNNSSGSRISNTTTGGYLAIYSNTGGLYLGGFNGGNQNYMYIPANTGNVNINYTGDAGYKLYVVGTIYATGNITANSDLTLKKNLTIIENPTDKLMQLNGYSYQWKSDDSHQYGVIAQEVEKILPYAVSTGNDGIKGVSYNQIIAVLIEAVKEQKAKIENLEILLASK